jgi:hypothetical protein
MVLFGQCEPFTTISRRRFTASLAGALAGPAVLSHGVDGRRVASAAELMRDDAHAGGVLIFPTYPIAID